MAQGALLLSYHSTESERHLNTFWLGIALRSAREAGAHRYDQDEILTLNEMKTKKKLWWCCLLRDNILALGVRRPLQIRPEHIDTHAVRSTTNELYEQLGNSEIYDSQTQCLLAKLWAAQCKLVIELIDIMTLLYPSNDLVPVKSANKTDFHTVFHVCSFYKSKLRDWFEEAQSWVTELPKDTHPSVMLFTSLMNIYYQWVSPKMKSESLLK